MPIAVSGELKVSWRRKSRIAHLIVKYELDDRHAHKLVFEMTNENLRLFIDCIEAVSGQYPEIDFSILERHKPRVWVGQRFWGNSTFIGDIYNVSMQSGAGYHCNSGGRSSFVKPPFGQQEPSSTPNIPQENTLNEETQKTVIKELSQRVKYLENEMKHWRPMASAPSQSSEVVDHDLVQNKTFGEACPHCWEYISFKVNYLEEEFKRWRHNVNKINHHLKKLLLHQRGCQVW
ncbi:unnamed protein product [Soboliphyme baturini]|uniref:FERM domain-containing protein n=1 Tax=Soboliphyme baturini TaxID=241478 RepID=A0A183J9S6_9BILA|nr:unnamed protein product [Soboliphyme baturini]